MSPRIDPPRKGNPSPATSPIKLPASSECKAKESKESWFGLGMSGLIGSVVAVDTLGALLGALVG